MKKKFFTILIILIIISSIATLIILNYRKAKANIVNFNKEYESWYNKEILGTDLMSIINKTSDNNEKNGIDKNDKNEYIEDNGKSVKIYVKFSESDEIYKMEDISNSGAETFVKYFSGFKFKCTKIEYHQNGNVKEMFFEQI